MVDSGLKIETYQYSDKSPFVSIYNFNFEIRRLEGSACITTPHFEGVFISPLDKDITEDQARYILYAYLKGHDDGVKSVYKPEKLVRQIQRSQGAY